MGVFGAALGGHSGQRQRIPFFQMRKIPAREQEHFGKQFSALTVGWGARIRTWEWRNQNQFDYPTISRRIWKKRSKHALATSIAWQTFPNEKQSLAGRINPRQFLGCRSRKFYPRGFAR